MAKCRSHQMDILEKHLREIKWRIKPGRREKLFTRIYHFKFELKLTLFHHPIMLQFHLNPIFLSLSLSLCFLLCIPHNLFSFFFFFLKQLGLKPIYASSPHKEQTTQQTPPPPHVVGFTKSALYLAISFSFDKDFVNLPDPFSLVSIFSWCSCFVSSTLQIQWYLTSICLDFE